MKSQPVLSQPQMEALCQEVQRRLAGSFLTHCFKLSDKQWVLEFNYTHPIRLLLSLQQPFLRFHFVEKKSSHGLDLHPLDTHLAGAQFKKAEMLNQDRILQLTLQKSSKEFFLICEFFPKRPNSYLTDNSYHILYSLYPVTETHYQPPASSFKAQDFLPLLNHQETEDYYNRLEQDFLFQKDKKDIENRFKGQIRQLTKRQHALKKSLEACTHWPAIQHEGELLKTHFSSLKQGMTQVTVWDWLEDKHRILFLNPEKRPQDELADRFRRSKKLQLGIPHLEKQMAKIENQLKTAESHLNDVQQIETSEELEAFKRQHGLLWKSQFQTVEKQATALPYHEFESEAGLKIWVGRSANANEQLTFSLARGLDWWLHVQDYPGSHVIVRTNKGKEPDNETLLDAIQLALYYSKAKLRGEGEVCITQRKFVSRFGKKQPGKVQVSKHKTVFARLDAERYEKLKNRREKRF